MKQVAKWQSKGMCRSVLSCTGLKKLLPTFENWTFSQISDFRLLLKKNYKIWQSWVYISTCQKLVGVEVTHPWPL